MWSERQLNLVYNYFIYTNHVITIRNHRCKLAGLGVYALARAPGLEPLFLYVAKMAKISALGDTDGLVRQQLASVLRPKDTAVILPQFHRSSEGGGFKNVSIQLCGDEKFHDVSFMSPKWFSGVSCLEIPATIAEPLLKDHATRTALLQTLSRAIPSETQSTDIDVGPQLDGDENDRDKEPWLAGLDGPGSSIGLYSTFRSVSADMENVGLRRRHAAYFLVCKAGGGVAAQVFHSRLVGALSKGESLNSCLRDTKAVPGAAALRRVGLAGERNRARILEMAAKAIGYHDLDTVSDNASPEGQSYRMAVTAVSIHTNTLRELDGSSLWQYTAGCVDSASGIGLMSASSAMEGFILFTDNTGSFNITIKNPAFNCIPFSSVRISNDRDCVIHAAEAATNKMSTSEQVSWSLGSSGHPDHEWVKERFAWHSKDVGFDMEPPPLWGSYAPEEYSSSWCRELGLSTLRLLRLEPELVVLAAVDPGKLRAVRKHMVSTESVIGIK